MRRCLLRGLPALLLLSAVTPAQSFRLAPPLATNTTAGGGFLAIDLDKNGEQDGLFIGSSISVVYNPGLTRPSATVKTFYSPLSGYINDGYFADLNSDGIVDGVVEEISLFAGQAKVLYLPGNGTGFGAPVSLAVTAGQGTDIAVGDFNGDGQADVAYLDLPQTGSPSVTILGQKNGVFSPIYTQAVPAGISGIEAGDFDGDGADELAWYASGSLWVLAGTRGTFGAPTMRAIEKGLNGGFVSDLDHDGFGDLVMQETSFSGWRVDVWFGSAAGLPSQWQVIVPAGNPARCDYIGPFDVDADGNDDLLCALRNKPGYAVIRNDGSRGFSPTPFQTEMNGGLIDLDGDGDFDLLQPVLFGTGYRRAENLARYGAACPRVSARTLSCSS